MVSELRNLLIGMMAILVVGYSAKNLILYITLPNSY